MNSIKTDENTHEKNIFYETYISGCIGIIVFLVDIIYFLFTVYDIYMIHIDIYVNVYIYMIQYHQYTYILINMHIQGVPKKR